MRTRWHSDLPMWTLAAVLFVVLLIGGQCYQQGKCEDAGGTYFTREWKCLDVKEIKP